MKQEPTLVRVNSHSVTLNKSGSGPKEELFFYFDSEWRGQPVSVTMEASRYSYSRSSDTPEWSDWRIYANDAREGTWADTLDSNYRTSRGSHLTDLARRRMSEALAPLCAEWLASDAYGPQESAAYFRAIKNELYDARPYNHGSATDTPRRMVAQYAGKLTAAQASSLLELCDAFDAFATLYTETEA